MQANHIAPPEGCGLDALHRFMTQNLGAEFRKTVRLLYEPGEDKFPAVILHYSGHVFRLEPDDFDNKWTLATDEDCPRLLDRISKENFESALRRALDLEI